MWDKTLAMCCLGQLFLWLSLPGQVAQGQEARRQNAAGQNAAGQNATGQGPTAPQVMTARVDELLDASLRASGWQAAGACADAEFLRRASLDLTGVPPTASEVLAFIKDGDAATDAAKTTAGDALQSSTEKRGQLIERLLASPVAATHMAATWGNWMLPEEQGPGQQLGRQGLESWLRNRFAENLRYDRLVSDLLVSTGPPQAGPTAFFVALEGKPEKIAAKTARVFLGLQLDCAECHDHPFDKWSQRDFWGFAAYFAQLSAGDELAMQREGDVIDTGEGEVRLPGEEEIVPPSPLVATGQSGLTSGTRRQQLTLWLTARENPFVARAAVNRVWALLFGRGLIEPVDDMRDMEMASHPQLLRELSEYFADSGYDLRGLLGVLAKTQAYSRSGRHESGVPPPESYAILPAKPLTELQLSTALAAVARQVSGDDNQAQQSALTSQLGKLRGDGSEAKLGIVNALVTLHGVAFDNVSREQTSRLLKALEAPYMDQRQQLRWMFLATLSREPMAAELQAFSAEFPSEDDVSASRAWRSDLLWALINSTEFAMTP